MPGSIDEQLKLKEYLIDGNTAVDDLLFAKLHADMDRRVLGVLDIDQGSCGIRVGPEQFSEALRRANEMLEAGLQDRDQDGLEALSTSSSSATSDVEEGCVITAGGAAGRERIKFEDVDVMEEGEMAEGVEEFKADKILELPPEMTPKSIPETVEEDDILILVGSLEFEVEDMLTVRVAAFGSSKFRVWELGSLCCLANRKVIGYVIDTMGPTQEPLYVVKKTCTYQVPAGVEIYTTQKSAVAALDEV